MSDNTLEKAANKDRSVEKAVEKLTLDEKIQKLDRFIHFEPLIREIDYKILTYCLKRRNLSDIEERIAQYPEFKAAPRDQYSLITELVEQQGLEFFELDEAGNVVLESDKAGLSENEIDDLVVDFAYQTTEAGKVISEQYNPQRRMLELFETVPQRYETYIEILAFLQDRHSFAEVDSLLRGRETSFAEQGEHTQTVQSSVFIDKLERAGGVFFNEGWHITEAGREVLASVKNRAQD